MPSSDATSGVRGATETPSAALSSLGLSDSLSPFRRASLSALSSSSLTVTWRSLPSRMMVRSAFVPGPALAMRLRNELKSCTASPLSAVMTSPCLRPARSAALPAVTDPTITPPGCLSPRFAAMSDVTFCTETPSCARVTLPFVRSCSITFFAMFAGIAKPMPMLPPVSDRICELIPTSSPFVFTSAPPEFP